MVAIPKTMKAAVIEAKGKLVVKEVPVPEPGYGEVLVKVYTSGVCHTDLHALDCDWLVPPNLPVIPGHEGAGIVVKLGEGVKNLKVGDRVGSAWLHDSCQSCEHCLAGWETVCSQQHQTGYMSNGCHAEYTVSLESFVSKLPEHVSFAQAAPLLCAGVTTYKGLKQTECKPGQWVAIHGAAGGLGHLAVQYAKAMGLKVIAIDFGKEKLEHCKTLGADEALEASAEDLIQQVQTVTLGGSHGALVLAPAIGAYEQAFNYVRTRGTIVGCGLPTGPAKIDVFLHILFAKTFRGSIVGTRLDMIEALGLASTCKIQSTVAEDKIENLADVFEKMKKGQIKGRVVLRLAEE